jgi:hypothetical protein
MMMMLLLLFGGTKHGNNRLRRARCHGETDRVWDNVDQTKFVLVGNIRLNSCPMRNMNLLRLVSFIDLRSVIE